MEYSCISKELTKKLSKEVKKNNGIYFTPPSCVKHNLELLKPYLDTYSGTINVLEPSCGSCEYVNALHSSFPEASITGIEYNDTIYNSVVVLENDKVKIFKMDYLQCDMGQKYDLIIGNPPFYVLKKDAVDKKYYEYFEGRPNIYILFIIKSLSLLNDGGILSFVLPKNFINCLYYDKTRKYIAQHFQILHMEDCKEDKYMETQQETILLILQKPVNINNAEKIQINNADFVLFINNYTLFYNETNIMLLKKLGENSKTLRQLGFKVSVGSVVWNQCKHILTDDNSQTRLIYSSDIVNNELSMKTYGNDKKKNFIKKPGMKKSMLVINRGYGVGEYKFNHCLIDTEKDYLIENHLICIEYTKEDLTRTQLISEYKKIITSLNNEKTQEFIRNYFGNNAINTTELATILPMYI